MTESGVTLYVRETQQVRLYVRETQQVRVYVRETQQVRVYVRDTRAVSIYIRDASSGDTPSLIGTKKVGAYEPGVSMNVTDTTPRLFVRGSS